MKLLLKTFVLLAISTSSFAQLTKGNWLVGGSSSFSSTNSSTSYPNNAEVKSEEINLAISPNLGYFLLDKFAIGLSPSFTWGKGKATTVGGGNTNIKRFLIGPFARYYLLDIEKPYNILVGASYQYGIYSFKPTNGKLATFSVAAGPVIYFNSSVGLEFTFGYASRVDDIKDSYKTTQKGFQMGIGFQIHLEKE